MRRAVITGLGAISTLGLSLADISASLRDGVSGVGIDEERKARGFRSALTGVVKGFDPAARFDRKARKTMGQAAAYGCGGPPNGMSKFWNDGAVQPLAVHRSVQLPMFRAPPGGDACTSRTPQT